MWNPLSWVMEAAAIMAIALAHGGILIVLIFLASKSTISFIEGNNAGNAAATLMARLAPKAKKHFHARVRDFNQHHFNMGWSFTERPGLLLVVAFIIAQLIATVISATANWKFTRIKSIGCGWTGVIWLFIIVTYLALDPLKFSVRYALSGRAWGLLVNQRVSLFSLQILSISTNLVKNPLSWVMEAAAIMAIALAQGEKNPDYHYFGGIIILLAINSTISFIEENNAGNAAAALMAYLYLRINLDYSFRVLRDGRLSEEDAAGLVPGDIVNIKLGDIVLADARLLEGDPLKIDESAITGEFHPVTKNPGDGVYSGSTCKQEYAMHGPWWVGIVKTNLDCDAGWLDIVQQRVNGKARQDKVGTRCVQGTSLADDKKAWHARVCVGWLCDMQCWCDVCCISCAMGGTVSQVCVCGEQFKMDIEQRQAVLIDDFIKQASTLAPVIVEATSHRSKNALTNLLDAMSSPSTTHVFSPGFSTSSPINAPLKRVGTHNDNLYCDEALGYFRIRLTDKFSNAQIICTRDLKGLDKLDTVLDVRGVYDPSNDRGEMLDRCPSIFYLFVWDASFIMDDIMVLCEDVGSCKCHEISCQRNALAQNLASFGMQCCTKVHLD
ncbi:hypothetical protein QYF36_020153 [Acer negundo]|nr:hypothetical protein QYF36_016880 [Acer negundo]KAK4849042.1 hypothetical protein QYF36_020153 [Acer negundo]